MKWAWKLEPLDPATTTIEQLVAANKYHEFSRMIAVVAGIIAAVTLYWIWAGLGYEKKWVEYTLFPVTVIGGCLAYRLVYEIAIRFR